MFKIPSYIPQLGKEEASAVYKVTESGWITQGNKVREFENLIKKQIKAKYVVAVNNGTSSLHAILLALNISKQDEIIVPSLSYISAVNAVSYVGAKIILCDNNKDTFNVDLNSIKKKITNRTKAVITVDLKGMPINYIEINKYLKKRKIFHISDSAESFGSIYKGKPVGSRYADFFSFSFFANKGITTGEGGAIVTNNLNFYKKLISIRNQGQLGRFNHKFLGNNFRMTDILAAIGCIQIKKLNKIILKKNKIAKMYNLAFLKHKYIKAPFLPEYVDQHSWYLYSISVPKKYRDRLVKFLTKKSIETRLSFKPIHLQPLYKKSFKKTSKYLKNASFNYSTFIDLPIYPSLSKQNQKYIIDSINKFFKLKEI